jgi:hypothetical protein
MPLYSPARIRLWLATPRGQVSAFLVLIGCLAWLTWPTAGQLNVESCSPRGPIAGITVALHGNAFWRAQLEELSMRRRRAENYERTRTEVAAKLDEILRQAQARLDTLYATFPQLAPTHAQVATDALRARADAIETAEADMIANEFMQRLVEILARCEAIVTARLR